MKAKDQPALILVDIQKGFEDINYWGGHRNNPDAENNAGKLLDFWRLHNLPVLHIKHCSTNPASLLSEGKKGNDFKDIVRPIQGETVIKKNVNSAFIGTDLKEQLDRSGIKILVFAGLTTDHCISTSVRMAGNYGFNTFVVSDATATFDKTGPDGQKYPAELIHNTALASLHEEFATVITTDELISTISETGSGYK
jgi:nicotinamidase-related amidase